MMKTRRKALSILLCFCIFVCSIASSFTSHARISIHDLLKNGLFGNTLSENSLSENGLSDNSLSEDSLSDNSLSEDAVPEEDLMEYALSGEALSENAIPEDTISENTVSEDAISENTSLPDQRAGASSSLNATKKKSYTITYEYNGGYLQETTNPNTGETYNPTTYKSNSSEFTFASPVKKGAYFGGWFSDPSFTLPISGVTKDTSGDLIVYAKWTSAAPANAPTLKSAKNSSKGKAVVKYSTVKDTAGCELYYTYTKSFKTNVHTISLKNTTSSRTFTNLLKDKTYYFRMRSYNIDSTGEKCYSPYSAVISCKIKKGVTQYTAKSNSATLKSCKVSKGKNLYVKAKVPKRLKSGDDFYYLVTVDPNSQKVLKMIDKCEKTTTITFTLPLRKEDGTNLIQGKYAIAVKSKGKYKLISKTSYLTNPEAAASYTAAFPKTTSKKGLQGSLDTSLGVQHTFINIDLNEVIIPGGTPNYVYNGKSYCFNDIYGSYISNANKLGMTVTGQFMITWSSANKNLILKSARSGGHTYYALNTETKAARETLEAAFAFLAERYSQKDCHLDNWILGNEVNIHNVWYYAGNISRAKFIKTYANTFRVMYYAVKSNYKNARVYICLDHTWSDRHGDWGARPFMDAFHTEIKSQQKNIQWNLAFHAYPSILTSAATWNDQYVSNNDSSEFVSPKNLTVLTNYVKKHFGSKTRIILSEQGFTSTSGYSVQCAALAYTYYKAEFNTMIDSVIFRSDYDAAGELAQGLAFGLCDIYGNKKPAYDVFKYMDTPKAKTYTNKYLKTIGVSSWKKVAPKYTLTRFKKNVR
ncbi:MAG: InlB B-repeat-containing protein [Lachnospiraceae bacterium]|nr:InlB B-repeat-containing protein [Lachnospiraceae bacterium]